MQEEKPDLRQEGGNAVAVPPSRPGTSPEQLPEPSQDACAKRPARTAAPAPGGAPMADEDDPGLGVLAKWGARTLAELKGLGKRIFVHLAVFVCAAAAAVTTKSFLAGFCVYVGGICIVARGMSLSAAWLIPAGAGVLQAVLLALFGFPLPQALFWGGAQSWLQRLVQKRLCMGGEWGVLLFILPGAIYLFSATPVALLAGSFAGVAVIGGMLSQFAARRAQTAAKIRDMQRRGLSEPEKVAMYRASLADFKAKIVNLPHTVRPFGESIAISAGDIMDCMATDTRDLEPGHRFLNRYFKAAHSVVEKHISLSRETVITRELADALEKSREMLVRLDEVFAKEHTRLLQNDLTDFSADLAVIDTLLKMDGR